MWNDINFPSGSQTMVEGCSRVRWQKPWESWHGPLNLNLVNWSP